VLGSRQAEEVNFLYFENKSVPPLALLVSGGRLSAQSIPRIESFIETHIRGKRNFHKILILEAEPAGSGAGLEHTGRMKIELKPLTNAQQSDALFQNYDERNMDKVGQSSSAPGSCAATSATSTAPRRLGADVRRMRVSCPSAGVDFVINGSRRGHGHPLASARTR
jgi:capsid portal protein